MYPFSEKTIACLRAAGWHEDYRIDTEKEEAKAKAEGYSIPPVVLDFLQRFSGLFIREPLPEQAHLPLEELKWPGCRELYVYGDGKPRTNLRDMERRFGASALYLIGGEPHYVDIYMTPDGRVFWTVDGWHFRQAADSGEEYIDNIFKW